MTASEDNDTSNRLGCQRERTAGAIPMMNSTSSTHGGNNLLIENKEGNLKINYVPVENAVAEWGDKNSLLKRWEGLNKYTLNRWIAEMREHRQFKQYVINPTHKLVFINLDGFEEFLRWKQRIAVK